MQTVDHRKSLVIDTVGLALCAGLVCFSCRSGASSSGSSSSESRPGRSERAADKISEGARVSLPVSINGEPAKSIAYSIDADGYSAPVLSKLTAVGAASVWHALIVKAAGGARLTFALRRYPEAEAVLFRDPQSKVVQIGLRSRKTGAFLEGFVATGPIEMAVYDEAHLQPKRDKQPRALKVSFDKTKKTSLSAADLAPLTLYAPKNKGESKRTWWRLGEVVDKLRDKLPPSSPLIAHDLVVHYQVRGGSLASKTWPVLRLRQLGSDVLLKVNRRGQWKVWAQEKDRDAFSAVVESLSLVPAAAN